MRTSSISVAVIADTFLEIKHKNIENLLSYYLKVKFYLKTFLRMMSFKISMLSKLPSTQSILLKLSKLIAFSAVCFIKSI